MQNRKSPENWSFHFARAGTLEFKAATNQNIASIKSKKSDFISDIFLLHYKFI